MKYFFTSLFIFFSYLNIQAQNFDDYFTDSSLRLDYVFTGTATSQGIALDQLSQQPHWSGRRNNLSKILLKGNGQVSVSDLANGNVIYKDAFSTLFQEWQGTDEARSVKRSFENSFLVPFPKNKIRVEISLRNKDGLYETVVDHVVNPNDILIKKAGVQHVPTYSYLHRSETKDNSINVAILAEGYTAAEMSLFRDHAKTTVEQILAHEPFGQYADRFNFIAVETLSSNSGVSVPRNSVWKETAFGSHFDTFYADRYLTTRNVKNIHNQIAGVPYSHIIILANTNVYGGGGIFNAYTLTTTGHPGFKPVVVHEFGHSFAGLADEYFYEGGDVLDATYSLKTEPWEPNITTMVSFSDKWEDQLPENTPVPTDLGESEKYPTGVYEGAGYQTKGIYRPAVDCRMRTNTWREFCPVCQKAIEKLIKFYTE